MNEGGEVRAQFRLLSDNVKGDVSSIQNQIQNQLKESGKGTPLGQVNRDIDKIRSTDPTGKFVSKGVLDMVSKLNEKMRNQILEQQPDIKAAYERAFGKPSEEISETKEPSAGKPSRKAPPLLSETEEKRKRASELDRAKFIKDATFAMMPLFNPTSVWGNLFASRQIFSAFSGTETGGKLMGAAGLAGTGGAALAAGGVVAALMLVGAGIKALTKTIQESIKAYESARQTYAKALMSGGLSLGFVQKRSMMASVLGVSEQEVMRFGMQMNFLNPKLEWASDILAGTNRNLTAVGWQFKILQYDFQALFADIANQGAPALVRFANQLSIVIKSMDNWIDRHPKLVRAAMELPNALLYASGLGPNGSDVANKEREEFKAAPQPLAMMNRLPASALEHMGLVMGGGGAESPAQQTAQNTKKMAGYLQQIVKGFQDRTGGKIMNQFNPAQSYQ